MFEFKESLNLLDFDIKSYTKTLDRVAGQVFRESIREWLRVLLVYYEIPVETGMAKATLLPVSRWLGNIDFSNVIIPQRDDYWHVIENSMANIPEGEKKSTFTLIDDKNHPLNFIYQFNWEEYVLHFWVEKYYSNEGNKYPTDWGEYLLKKAREAFFEFFYETFPRRIPEIAPYLKRKKR